MVFTCFSDGVQLNANPKLGGLDPGSSVGFASDCKRSSNHFIVYELTFVATIDVAINRMNDDGGFLPAYS